MEIIYLILFCFIASFFMFPVYLAIMNLKRNKEKMTMPAKVLGYPWLYIGLVMDVCYNFTVGTVLFLELPRELLMTDRCKRHADSNGWRFKVSKWFCTNLLSPFDPNGKHCGKF